MNAPATLCSVSSHEGAHTAPGLGQVRDVPKLPVRDMPSSLS